MIRWGSTTELLVKSGKDRKPGETDGGHLRADGSKDREESKSGVIVGDGQHAAARPCCPEGVIVRPSDSCELFNSITSFYCQKESKCPTGSGSPT